MRNMMSHISIVIIWLPTLEILLIVWYLIQRMIRKILRRKVLKWGVVLIVSHLLFLLVSKQLLLLMSQYHAATHHRLLILAPSGLLININYISVVHSFSQNFFQSFPYLSLTSWALRLRSHSAVYYAGNTTGQARGATKLLDLIVLTVTYATFAKNIVHMEARQLQFLQIKIPYLDQYTQYLENQKIDYLNFNKYQFKYLERMRKTNRRRFRTDGDSTQLTLNVDTSQPFTMTSPMQPLFNIRQSSNRNIDAEQNNIQDHSQNKFQNHDYEKKLVQFSNQYYQQLNINNLHTKSNIPPQSNNISHITTLSIQQPQQRAIHEDQFYLIKDQQLYLKYKKLDYQQNQGKKQLQNCQSSQKKKNKEQLIELQKNLRIIPKISFLNAFIQKIMDKLQGQNNNSTKTQVENIMKKSELSSIEQRNRVLHRAKLRIEQKVPPVYIFQPIAKRKKGENAQNSTLRRKIHRNYLIRYQMQMVRYDSGKRVKIIKGNFNAGHINPFLTKTTQFIISLIVKRCKGVIKYIAEHIQVLQFQKQGEVNIKIYCIIKPIVLPKLQSTYISLEEEQVRGLRVYTPEVQITFNKPIKISKVNLSDQISINNYGVKLSQQLDQNVTLIFRNMCLNYSSRQQFIRFFQQNSYELSENFVDFLYDKYINIGAASI